MFRQDCKDSGFKFLHSVLLHGNYFAKASLKPDDKFYFSLFAYILFALFLLAGCERDFSPIIIKPNQQPKGNPYKIVKSGYPDWSPTGERLAFIRDNDLYLYYFEDEHVEKVTQNATEPSFDPDGKMIAFERERKIYTIDLETMQERYLADGITPSWSENGKWIAFGHKDAQRVLTDGTQVWGQPSPDSSLYYYNLETDSIIRVIVTNYDSLWIGENLSMSHPEWVRSDSILLFDTEYCIWKVNRKGGVAVYYSEQFEDYNFKKTNMTLELAYSGQPNWSSTQKLISFFVTIDQRPFGDVIKSVQIQPLKMGPGIGITGGYSDPNWSPDGKKLAMVKDDCIIVYDLSEYDEIIN